MAYLDHEQRSRGRYHRRARCVISRIAIPPLYVMFQAMRERLRLSARDKEVSAKTTTGVEARKTPRSRRMRRSCCAVFFLFTSLEPMARARRRAVYPLQ
jgi:hypothetical protein